MQASIVLHGLRRRVRSPVSVILALAAISAATDARAEANCGLTQLASLPLTQTSNGMLAIPVTIDGAIEQFVVSINQPISSVSQSLASKRQFIQKTLQGSEWSGYGFLTYAGQIAYTKAFIPTIEVGRAASTTDQVLVTPRPVSPDTSGLLGLDFLSNFDVELNFKQMRLNLFSPEHCRGNVVYWGRPYEVLPIVNGDHGFRYFEMQLDGKPISVSMNIAEEDARMGQADAMAMFGIASGDPRLKLRQDRSMQSDPNILSDKIPGRPNYKLTATPPKSGSNFYDFQFKALAAGGIVFNNLHVLLFPQESPQPCSADKKPIFGGAYVSRCFGYVNLTLGRHELRQLRLYFAFKEKNLYVTAADTDAQTTPSTPASGPAAGEPLR